MELLASKRWREELFSKIHAPPVLEAGIGTGKNIPYHRIGPVHGIDFSFNMIHRAQMRKSTHMRPSLDGRFHLAQMDIEHIGFPDNSFATIVATFVFCSVPDPVNGLRELGRVCRPDGTIFLLEHMRPSAPLAGKLFDLINPLTYWLSGTHINRETIANIQRAGLNIVSTENLASDIVKMIVCRKPTL